MNKYYVSLVFAAVAISVLIILALHKPGVAQEQEVVMPERKCITREVHVGGEFTIPEHMVVVNVSVKTFLTTQIVVVVACDKN